MADKSHDELLDDVLRAIGLASQLKQLKIDFPDNGLLNHHVLVQIIEQLRDDGYVYVVTSNNEYVFKEPTDENYIRRSFRGVRFIILDGGYYKLRQKQNADATRQATEALRNEYLFWITLSIGVSTFVAAVYYFLEIQKNHPCWAVCTLTIAALTPILLLVNTPKRHKKR